MYTEEERREVAWRRMSAEEKQAADPQRFLTEQAARAEQQAQAQARWTADQLCRLNERLGPRYAGATLESYHVATDGQRAALVALRDYADRLRDYGREGRGIVLYGGCGTGKDHLLGSLARIAIGKYHVAVEWIRGVDLYARFRDAIRTDTSESEIVDPLAAVPVLIISDPLPPVGPLTEFQAAALLRIIDERYRMMRRTWTSVNVASGAEADQRLGAQVADRLRDGALCIYCDWPTYRKAGTWSKDAR